jgi:large subunit ribosomal protein L47
MRTMKAIKHVLTERYYLWEDAHRLARTDKEINLDGTGDAYTPIEDQEVLEEEEEEEKQLRAASREAKSPNPAPA